MSKYAAEFGFQTSHLFGPTNPAFRRKVNFMNMTDAAIEALSDVDLKEGLLARGRFEQQPRKTGIDQKSPKPVTPRRVTA